MTTQYTAIDAATEIHSQMSDDNKIEYTRHAWSEGIGCMDFDWNMLELSDILDHLDTLVGS